MSGLVRHCVPGGRSTALALALVVLLAGCDWHGVFGDSSRPIRLTAGQLGALRRYEEGFASLRGGGGCVAFDNSDGTLSWAESYLLESYLDLYEATGRSIYLERFVRDADALLTLTDVALGRSDYEGVQRWAWTATRYSTSGERAAWIVDQAVIASPLARFAALAESPIGVPSPWRERASEYRMVAANVLAEFDSDYRSDVLTGTGQYIMPAGSPTQTAHPTLDRPNPLNWDASAGRLHLLLHQAGAGGVHLQRAIELGRRVRGELELMGTRYVWHYWAADGRALFHSGWEDIAHATLETDFAALLADANLVFEREDLARMARSLLVQRAPDGGFLRRVEGPEADLVMDDPKCGALWPRRYSDSAGLWLVLAPALPELIAPVEAFMTERASSPVGSDPQLLAGLARVVRYSH